MFDNPKKNLKDLDTALRLEEWDQEEPEEAYEEEDELPPMPGRIAKRQVKRQFRENSAKEQKLLKKEKKRKSPRKVAFGGQLLLAIGEIILIILIVRWWLSWI